MSSQVRGLISFLTVLLAVLLDRGSALPKDGDVALRFAIKGATVRERVRLHTTSVQHGLAVLIEV